MPEFPRVPVATRDRHLVDQHGEPFFWLGDTAWELIHRCNRDEIQMYAETRAKQRFNVVQTVILAELDGLRDPNPQGHTPLVDLDPTQPDPAYFEDVDFAVKTLNDAGLVACLLPTWGDKVHKGWGVGPEVFGEDAPSEEEAIDRAMVFGDFLGDRYKDAAVVWMMVGDRRCTKPLHRQVWDAMAAGLRHGMDGRQLITSHAQGGTTSVDTLGGDPDWCDFHAIQSGHASNRNGPALLNKLAGETAKPFFESEACYEEHPIMTPKWDGHDGYWSAEQVIKTAYESVEHGSFGYTYGAGPVWQMWQEGREPKQPMRMDWKAALEIPGARAMAEFRDWAEARGA
ncbi:MAG: DUF4038 domain-containing protein [Planctomycetota bacterium]